MIILHSLAVNVEQLCARSTEAPSRNQIRPNHCVICGQAARNANGVLQLVACIRGKFAGLRKKDGSPYGFNDSYALCAAIQ